MNWIGTILVTGGYSCGIFAELIYHGARLGVIKKKTLAIEALLFIIWQIASLLFGVFIGHIVVATERNVTIGNTAEIVAAAVFALFGANMIRLRIKNELFHEKLAPKMKWGELIARISILSVGTLFCGIALGFLRTTYLSVFVAILIETAIVVVGGVYVGYRYGEEQKKKAYLLGGLLLFAATVATIYYFII